MTVRNLVTQETDPIPTWTTSQRTDDVQSGNGGACITKAANHHPRVAVLFERFGPYHIARLNHAAHYMAVQGIELSSTDRTYSWASTKGLERFPRHTLSGDIRSERPRDIIERLSDILSMIRPDAVAIPGWSEPGALAALMWCLHSGTASVLMSDSTELDEVRRPWKEAIKRRVVSLFSSALVAGQPQCAYLMQLGMPADRIFDGYDVVDNEYFRIHADAARLGAANERSRLGLPPSYFLACCRFVEKKNLFRLIAAFAQYRQRTVVDAWDLVLIGDGPLRPDLIRLVVRYGLEEAVHLPGFQQYEAMPSYYGLAGAFVHASTTEQWGLVVNEAMAAGLPVIVSDRCGCAPDLVFRARNGDISILST